MVAARIAKSRRPPSAGSDLVDTLVIANRILSDHDVVDAFGHVSVRHDRDPTKFLMSRHLAPGLVTAKDIVTFDLDANAVANPAQRYYSERFIHSEIYKRRPDVVAVVHCHAPPLIPFGATHTPLRPIYHMSGYLGDGTPVFDIREAGGMTDMLIRTPALGAALAETLADKPLVLMRGHGATMVGAGIPQVVYRAIYARLNAELQMDALKLGTPVYLAPEEAEKAAAAIDRSLERAWNLWADTAQAKMKGRRV
ncbi:MAG: class II aldolase/adducin family protein [Stellaceae bacterium]